MGYDASPIPDRRLSLFADLIATGALTDVQAQALTEPGLVHFAGLSRLTMSSDPPVAFLTLVDHLDRELRIVLSRTDAERIAGSEPVSVADQGQMPSDETKPANVPAAGGEPASALARAVWIASMFPPPWRLGRSMAPTPADLAEES